MNLGEGVPGQRLAGVEWCVPNTKANILDVSVLDEVSVSAERKRRVHEKLEKSLAGEVPAALVEANNKSVRVGEGVSEGNDGGLAVVCARELLCLWENDGEVDWLEDAAILLVIRMYARPCRKTYSC